MLSVRGLLVVFATALMPTGAWATTYEEWRTATGCFAASSILLFLHLFICSRQKLVTRAKTISWSVPPPGVNHEDD